MKFDVIVGNPPYQLGGAIENQNNRNAAFASAIYPKFVEQAARLHPRHLVMIVPSRWMTKTGQGVPVKWCDEMIQSNHFLTIDDFQDASDCFPGVEIKGGVCYFHYSEDYKGKCRYTIHQGNETRTVTDFLDSLGAGVVIRDPIARDVIDKIVAVEGEYYNGSSFSRLVGPVHLFDKDGKLGTRWDDFVVKKDASHPIKYYLNKRVVDSGYAWIRLNDIPKGRESVPLHKVYISEAYGAGEGFPHQILGVPFYGEPNSVCSETYLAIGYDQCLDKASCENIVQYIKTKFFRFMVYVKKRTQHAVSAVYQFVPMQDFSKPWTDAELYAKYKLTKDEIAFIESMIKPME